MQLSPVITLIYFLSMGRAEQWCSQDMYETALHTHSEKLQVLVIWFPVRAGTHSSLQLCSKRRGVPIERDCSSNVQRGANATWAVIDKQDKLLNCSLIDNKCWPEEFSHAYVLKNNAIENHTNLWLPGQLGELGKTRDPCLLQTGLPLTRQCHYSSEQTAAVWEGRDFANVKCLRDINQDIVTYDLNKLYQEVRENNATSAEDSASAATKLTNLLTKANTVRIPADLQISTNILEIITQNDKQPELMPKVLKATNLLMKSDNEIVRTASELGIPTALVKTVEKYFEDMTNVLTPNCSSGLSGVKRVSENLLSVFYINPVCSNISGISVYSSSAHHSKNMSYDSATNTYYRYIYMNQSLKLIMNEPHVEAATYLPETLWKAILAKNSNMIINNHIMRISMYRKPSFFVDKDNGKKTPDSVILSVSITAYKGDLPDEVPLIFQYNKTKDNAEPQCGNWNYNTWTGAGMATPNSQNLVLCKTKKPTFFSALIGVKHDKLIANSVLLTTLMEIALDLVSLAGCGLSLFGLFCIWMTALFCGQWRSKASNKLLLHLSFVLTLIMLYFLFVNVPELRNKLIDMNNSKYCIAEGAFLQYTILVLFLWMFLLAHRQYENYVVVLGLERPRHLVLKYTLAAWGIPLVPTALVVCLDATCFKHLSKDDNDLNAICYPSGLSLYLAVLLPISIIVAVNLGIFIYILCSIKRSLENFERTAVRKSFIVQVRLSILLFFLLGISWLFGILAHVDNSRISSLIFCLTATLQGFVLFIYFVVIDQKVRHSWLTYCCGREYYTLEETSMLPVNSRSTSN